MVPDGHHGLLVAWAHHYPSDQLTVQSIAPDSSRRWGEDGIALTDHWIPRAGPVVVGDQRGGALVFWGAGTGVGRADVVIGQHISADGRRLWGADGLVISQATTSLSGPLAAVPDGHGGAIIAWTGTSDSQDFGVLASRVSGGGRRLWPRDAHLCDAPGDRDQLFMSPVKDGGAITAWRDARAGIPRSIYAQRISPMGRIEWERGGSVVSTGTHDKGMPVMADDGTGSAFIAWSDTRPEGELYGMRLDPRGGPAHGWSENGTLISGWPERYYPGQPHQPIEYLVMTASGRGRAVLAWTDARGPAAEQTAVTLLTREEPAAPPPAVMAVPHIAPAGLADSRSMTGPTFALRAVSPNPVQGAAMVGFSLPDGAAASLELFDVAGRRVWRADV